MRNWGLIVLGVIFFVAGILFGGYVGDQIGGDAGTAVSFFIGMIVGGVSGNIIYAGWDY